MPGETSSGGPSGGRSAWSNSDISTREKKWDYVLCSDCIYDRGAHGALTHTLKRLVTNGTTVLLAYTRRSRHCDSFQERLEDAGLEVKRYEATDLVQVARSRPSHGHGSGGTAPTCMSNVTLLAAVLRP